MKDKMIIAATGDSFITRSLPSYDEKFFTDISQLLSNANVRFTNLEVTVHDMEGYPAAFSGGTWAMASPSVLNDLKKYGFNLYAWANNHTMDYSHGGLLATQKYLDMHQLVHAGAGENLADASSPKYLETSAGRVALISVTSTFHESWKAGEQRPDMIGRPGVNYLRYNTIYYITKEEMKKLKEITQGTYINAERNLAIMEGFEMENEKEFVLGDLTFSESDTKNKKTSPCLKDMNRLKQSISEASRQADVVLVSIHTHEMQKEDKTLPPEFFEKAAKEFIDSGADAIIGHGPHILRGIEIYKQKPIFYSLGNFIFHNETVKKLPADFYDKYQLNATHNVADALEQRSDYYTKGLGVNPKVWESVIAEWDIIEGNITEIRLHPIELGFNKPVYAKGWPEKSYSRNKEILQDIKKLSSAYGTTVNINNGVGIIHI